MGVPVVGVAAPVGVSPRSAHRDFAHHPDLPEYDQDVYHVAGHRLCIGCFTTYPVFLALSTYLFLVQPVLHWVGLILVGSALASLQIVSSLGRARTRSSKAMIKSALGVGLALLVYGVLLAPMAGRVQFLVLAVTLVLAKLSALPRAIRLRRAAKLRRCGHA